MKFGFRIPSVKKLICARTAPKREVRHNLGVKGPPGLGCFSKPKQTAPNRIYKRTSAGCTKLLIAIALTISTATAALTAPAKLWPHLGRRLLHLLQRKRLLLTLIVVQAFLVGEVVHSQGSRQPNLNLSIGPTPSPTPEHPDKRSFSDRPFDAASLEWERVPAEFHGNDFIKLYEALSSLRLGIKDEFETSDAYERRLLESQQEFLFGSLTPVSPLSFSLEHIVSSYDADAQVLTVDLPVGRHRILGREAGFYNSPGIHILTPAVSDSGSYEGQNAFGVKKDVRRNTVKNYVFAFENTRDFKTFIKDKSKGWFRTNDDFEIPVSLSPDRARDAKENLAAILIVRLERPFIGTYLERTRPTLDLPSDIFKVNQLLIGRLDQVWIFNRASGEIYKKIISVPITSGTLKIKRFRLTSVEEFLLLDKSMAEILTLTGAPAIEKTKEGGVSDLFATFLKAIRSKNKKYKPFLEVVTPEIKRHTLRRIKPAGYEDLILENLDFGSYYLFGASTEYGRTSIWDIPLIMKSEEEEIYLSQPTYEIDR